jgi:hypothetical protein
MLEEEVLHQFLRGVVGGQDGGHGFYFNYDLWHGISNYFAARRIIKRVF